jgi:hypothetical protein
VCKSRETLHRNGVKVVRTQPPGPVDWLCGACFCRQLRLPASTELVKRTSAYGVVDDTALEAALSAPPPASAAPAGGRTTSPTRARAAAAAPAPAVAPVGSLYSAVPADAFHPPPLAESSYGIVPESAFSVAEADGVYGPISGLVPSIEPASAAKVGGGVYAPFSELVQQPPNARPAQPAAYDAVAPPASYDIVAPPAAIAADVLVGYGRVPSETPNRRPEGNAYDTVAQAAPAVLRLPPKPTAASMANALPPKPTGSPVVGRSLPARPPAQQKQPQQQQQQQQPVATPAAARSKHYDELSLNAAHYDDVTAAADAVPCAAPELLSTPWYHGAITREASEALLQAEPPHSFLLRDGSRGGFVFAIKKHDTASPFHNILAERLPGGHFKLGTDKTLYESLDAIHAAFRNYTGVFKMVFPIARGPAIDA